MEFWKPKSEEAYKACYAGKVYLDVAEHALRQAMVAINSQSNIHANRKMRMLWDNFQEQRIAIQDELERSMDWSIDT